ncbi:hypothetical protein D9619_003016 [Psilocybe cf. subviscida]|uniref:Uncharacterized protein n=1 Tax=Psilocybe cf. subviscida TaxID=2480587 RepID=A0A8H5AVZ8_9AGAR|nr:hypothetical protein D9619_003016 [Psilocybe cf. subviscida]
MSTHPADISASTTSDTSSTSQDATTPPPDSTEGTSEHPDKPPSPPRPLRKYSRKQLVRLSASPLVKPPDNMPELKVWFGSDNENALKKEEPPTPSTARERRFRRDAEDGDAPTRPSFRAALSQPSQMGNFKHQSLRADRERDRDRDRDGDKAKIGDTTRLQDVGLSDRYDRDRLGLPLPNSRTNKERDPAPHLAANTRSAQALSSNAASRRGETREVGGKKKVGEASEDWRRGAEPPKREDGRERARSRVRESSRSRRDPSSGRRDKDRDGERPPRGDRDRDDRREKDDSRRDRDLDLEDDPRRWRDDGKREERLASRRDKRDKGAGDSWDASGDKRWASGEDRDGRYKRTTGRERKANGLDDLKDRDDRRDKEREKEKEPAWMDTYVPSESTPGILGGQAPTGELDGIQAWKKGLKEREQHKEKDSISLVAPKAAEPSQPPQPENAEKLDEIQLFKLIMKKEQETKRPEGSSEGESFPQTATKAEDSASQPWQRGVEDVLGGRLSNTTPKLDTFSSSKPSSPYPAQFPPGLKDLSTIAAQSSLPAESAHDRALSSALETSQHAVKPSTDFGPPSGNGFQPPAGSRLLALASRGPPKAPVPSQPLNGTGLQALGLEPNFAKNDLRRQSPGFSPFEEQSRQSYILEEPRDIGLSQNQLAVNRGQIEQSYGNPAEAYNGMNANKGSRFAKFFDGKVREGVPANKPHQALGFGGNSPNPGQRLEQGSFGGLGPVSNGEQKTVEDLFAMLNISSQRNNMHASNAALGNNGGFNGHANAGVHPFQQQQQQPQHLHQQQQHLINRLEPLYDSRSDDRSFVPDGMVPGLRPIPPPNRGRELPVHFSEQEDQIHYNLQRLAQQQQLQQQQQQQALNQRNLDPLYGGGPNPALLAQQGGRHGLSLQNLQQQQQQQQFRGGPSPTFSQGGSLGNGPQQRLPPGLANLGGRPPHDPNQFLGLQGHPSAHHHNALQGNGLLPQQQQQVPFNNFNVGNLNFNGAQGRGPAHNIHNAGLQQLPLGNLGNPHMDPRLATHNHLMGLGGSGVGGGNRMNGGFPQQQGPAPSHLGMRQQQGQLPPHMQHPHLLPPHMQQQVQPGTSNQAQDLMALLMGGHRD